MNPWSLFFGSLARTLLGGVFAWLVARKLVDKELVDTLPVSDMAVGIVGFLWVAGWSLWQKARARWSWLNALYTNPAIRTEKEVSDAKGTVTDTAVAFAAPMVASLTPTTK